LKPSVPTTSSPTIDERPSAAQSFWPAWRWWLAPALVALALALLFLDPFIGDWDGLDYTVLALRGQPSSMALGRALFIYWNHALYTLSHTLFGLRAEDAYLLFKYAVVATSPLAIIACWTLARDLTGRIEVATISALLVAVSPVFIIYSGQVMTDVPSVLLLAVALIIHLRGLRARRLWMMLMGAAIFGASVNVRESVAFYAPWLVIAPFVCGWRLGRREMAMIALSILTFAVFAFGVFAYLFLMDVGGFQASWHGWRESMRAESARHPVTIRNARPFMIYFFAVAPMVVVALPVAAFKEWRARGFSLLLALAGVGLWANLLLFFNYSTAVNWRYFLTGLPALTPLAASYFIDEQTARWRNERRAFISVVLGIAFISILFSIYMKPTSREHIMKRALTKDYGARLAHVPRDAVVMAGGQTVAVTYWRGVGLGEWDAIGTGGGWPGDRLATVIETYLRDGRRVFLDADPRWWSPCGWQLEETREIVQLESRFRFRHVSDTIYEIRPLVDDTARDAPNLKALLPENRPAEVKKCAALDKLT
jgi:Dolichyl-phosphate-mannose-protein mannosyltransferase